MAKTIHTFGENVVDLEGILSSPLVGGASLTTENLTLPLTTAIKIVDEKAGINYYGKVDIRDKNIVHLDSIAVRIPVDRKYNFDGSLTTQEEEAKWMKENNIKDFLRVILTKRTGGGGAHNSSIGEQVYINGSDGNLPLHVRLVVPWGSKAIQGGLPGGLVYDPIFGFNESDVAVNLNISLEYGKKLTFRSKPTTKDGSIELGGTQDGDMVIIDSIKSKEYISKVMKLFDANKTLKFCLAATDSMVNELGREAVYDLALRCDLYVSNETEFYMVMMEEKQTETDRTRKEKIVNFETDQALVESMGKLQEEQNKKFGKRGRIIVTHGELGSTLYDRDQKAYFQPVAQSPVRSPHTTPTKIRNTNGCGDAYFAIAVICEASGFPNTRTLSYANAAGHLCAFEDTASGQWMATQKRIKTFRENFGDPPIMFYSIMEKQFTQLLG